MVSKQALRRRVSEGGATEFVGEFHIRGTLTLRSSILTALLSQRPAGSLGGSDTPNPPWPLSVGRRGLFLWSPYNQKPHSYGDSFQPVWKLGYSTPKRQPGYPRKRWAAWTSALCSQNCKNLIKSVNRSDFPREQTKGLISIKAVTDPSGSHYILHPHPH